MKAIRKERLIAILEANFEADEPIFQNDQRLRTMWDVLADDWFIEGGVWTQFTNKEESD